MAGEFVGREHELGLLQSFLAEGGPGIAVIYGRRRIGKTLLIHTALAGRRALVFEGLEDQPKKAQVEAFLFQLARQAGPDTASGSAGGWREALVKLEPVLKRDPACIVLDEFQWMANYRKELVSDLKMVWEQYLAKIPGVKLILCGSIASFMTTKVVRSGALYGRTDLELHLKEFSLGESRLLLRDKGLDEVVEAALYVGGVPKYLELIEPHSSIRAAVEELAFRGNGYFVGEFQRIFTSHFGRNPDFRKIVSALAAAPQGLFRTDLIKAAGLDPGGTLSDHLRDLESAGFLTSDAAFDKGPNSRTIKYRVSDPYMFFYFCFIQRNLKKIRSGVQRDIFARLSQTGRFYAWRGKAWENLCIRHARRIAEILGFSGVDFSCGPYFRSPSRDRTGLQIDLLFSRADNVVTLCEMKCATTPIGMSTVKEVDRKATLLQRAFPSKTIQRVLVLHGEASREVVSAGYFYKVIHSADLAI